MSLRRAGILALPLLVVACTDVTQTPLPTDLLFARYASPNIPLPNDLALAAVPAAPCPALPSLQAQLLCNFKDNGGWPSDQESAITVPFTAVRWDPAAGDHGDYVGQDTPAIDLATVTPATVAVIRVDVTPNRVLRHVADNSVDPPLPAELEFSSTAGACTGTGGARTCAPALLTIRRAAVGGARRWDAGARYVVAVRGGASGVKTTDGRSPLADTAIDLALVGRDLRKPENQPLGEIPDSNENGTNADEVASLDGVRRTLNLGVTWGRTNGVWIDAASTTVTPAFQAIDAAFPHAEVVSATTFGTAPGNVVLIDSGAGVVPLPIDLLRTDADGTVINNPAFGAAAAGLDTLDGFSTTATILSQPSAPIRAGTVTGANVHLFKLGGATPVLVKELKRELGAAQLGDPTADPAAAGYVAEPDEISAACPPPLTGRCSTVIGLQPAVTAPVPGVGTFYLPPLDENTKYAVVITKRVLDVTGAPLARTSVGKILLGTSQPLVAGGASLLPGVSLDTATMLQTMRADLAPVLANLPTGTVADDIALAYTFKTQSITGLALALDPQTQNKTGLSLQLSAAPYQIESGAGQAIFQVTSVTPVAPPAPLANAAGTFRITFNSLDLIDKTRGTLRPTLAADLANPLPLITGLTALVVTPNPANVPACASPPFPAGTSCAKVVVVGHGLQGSQETLWAVADSLAARGFIAIATDFPMHGARAWCKANAECGVGGECTAFPGGAGMGDNPVLGTCTAGAPIPQISGQGFISANFFRIRDAFRQNLFDQSALVLAMSRPPTVPQPAQDARALLGLPANVLIDFTAVRWEGISLGSIAGAAVLATNPRFDRGALAVGGTTLVGLFTDQASDFAPVVDGVFLGLGIPRDQIATNSAVAAAYLRTINVAKWIVDPADPGNYARHVSLAPLPNLLDNPDASVAQAPKDTLGMVALGDTAIRNPYNELLYALMDSTAVVYQGPGGASVPHGFLGASAIGQADAASFLFDLTAPLSPVTLP